MTEINLYQSEVLNFLNLVLTIFLLIIMIRKKESETPFTSLYYNIALIILIILFLDSLFSDIFYISSKPPKNFIFYLNIIIINLSLAFSGISIWIYFIKKRKRNYDLVFYYTIISFFVLFIAFIIYLLISQFDVILDFYSSLIDEYQNKKFALHLLLTLIFIFFSLSLIVFLVILSYRIIRGFRENYKRKIKGIINTYLSNYIYSEGEEREHIKTQLNKFIKKSRERKQLSINELINLKKNLRGDTASKTRELFLYLELYKLSLKKLNNRKWFIVARGFRELSELQYVKAKNSIKKYLNSTNPILRSEAIFATASINIDNYDISFLSEYKYKLSLWDQINLHYNSVIQQKKITDLNKILKSNNDSVLCFAIRIIKLNKLNKYLNNVLNIITSLNSSNPASPRLRHEAYETLKYLDEPEDTEFLFENFFIETYKNKIKILEIFINFPRSFNFPYLKNILENTKDHKIKLNTFKSIYELGKPLNSYLESLTDTDPEIAHFARYINQQNALR